MHYILQRSDDGRYFARRGAWTDSADAAMKWSSVDAAKSSATALSIEISTPDTSVTVTCITILGE